jgi:hypothetical protein
MWQINGNVSVGIVVAVSIGLTARSLHMQLNPEFKMQCVGVTQQKLEKMGTEFSLVEF